MLFENDEVRAMADKVIKDAIYACVEEMKYEIDEVLGMIEMTALLRIFTQSEANHYKRQLLKNFIPPNYFSEEAIDLMDIQMTRDFVCNGNSKNV